MKLITKIRKLAEPRGVEVVEKANGHIQLKGPLLVNYYPESKNQCAYVAGTTKGVKYCSIENALDMCFTAPSISCKKDVRSSNSRRKREAMLRKNDKCHWCSKKLTLDTSTIEHIIPLVRGGLDNANNRTLACYECNQNRGGDMPELTNASLNDNY